MNLLIEHSHPYTVYTPLPKIKSARARVRTLGTPESFRFHLPSRRYEGRKAVHKSSAASHSMSIAFHRRAPSSINPREYMKLLANVVSRHLPRDSIDSKTGICRRSLAHEDHCVRENLLIFIWEE